MLHSSFLIILVKISFSSCASWNSDFRSDSIATLSPTSINLSQSWLSLASFREIRNRMTRSLPPSASLASIQFAGTDPEARTSCFASSIFDSVRGNRRTNLRIASANSAVLSSRSFVLSAINLAFEPLEFVIFSLADPAVAAPAAHLCLRDPTDSRSRSCPSRERGRASGRAPARACFRERE